MSVELSFHEDTGGTKFLLEHHPGFGRPTSRQGSLDLDPSRRPSSYFNEAVHSNLLHCPEDLDLTGLHLAHKTFATPTSIAEAIAS